MTLKKKYEGDLPSATFLFPHPGSRWCCPPMNHKGPGGLQFTIFTPNNLHSQVYVLLSANNQLTEKQYIHTRQGSAIPWTGCCICTNLCIIPVGDERYFMRFNQAPPILPQSLHSLNNQPITFIGSVITPLILPFSLQLLSKLQICETMLSLIWCNNLKH